MPPSDILAIKIEPAPELSLEALDQAIAAIKQAEERPIRFRMSNRLYWYLCRQTMTRRGFRRWRGKMKEMRREARRP